MVYDRTPVTATLKEPLGGWRIYGAGDVAMQITQFYSCQFSTKWSTELAKLVILRTSELREIH